MEIEGIALKITTDASQAEKSVKSIKTELKEAQAEAIALVKKFGEFSPEAEQAKQKLAELKDFVEDFGKQVDALSPDRKFQAFSSALQGVAGGFAGVQGAIGLFGTESKELEKQLLKVQSALALSEGLNSVLEAKDSFKNLGAIIKTNVVSAFTTLRGVIIATGIGALAVGLALLIANFETVKKVVLNLIPGLANVGSFIGKIVDKITDFVGVTSDASRAYDKLVASTKRGNEDIDARIKLLQAQGGQESEVAKLTKQRAESDLNVLRAKLKSEGKLNEEELAQFRALKNQKALIDVEETKRLNELGKQRSKEASDIAKAESNKVKVEAEAERKRIADELKKSFEDARDAYEAGQKELNEANKKSAEENRTANFDSFQKEVEDLTTAYNEKLNKSKEFGVDITAITEEYNRNIAELQKTQDQKDLEAQIAKDEAAIAKRQGDFANDLAILDAQRQAILSNTAITGEERKRLLEENSKAVKDIDKEEFQAKMAMMQAISEGLNTLSDLIGRDTAKGKALAVASSLINTYSAIAGQLKAFAGIPVPGYAVAQAIATGLTGFAAVKNILKVKVPGGAGGGGGGQSASNPISGVTPTQAPIASSVQITQTSLTQGGNNVNVQNQDVIKAFVVEKDITDSQDRISKIKAAATI